MANNFANDKAIEFEGLYKRALNMLDSFDELNINTQAFREMLESANEEVQNEAKNQSGDFSTPLNEMTYSNGIKKIESISDQIRKHDSYIRGNAISNSVSEELKQKRINTDKINEIATKLIGALIAINNSDTVYYKEEQKVVENLYENAYRAMILEFKIKNESKILEWAKTDSVGFDHLNNLVYEKSKDLNTPQIKETINLIRGDSGIDADYLDERLISLLADKRILNEVSDIENIKDDLNAILAKIEKIDSSILDDDKIKKLENRYDARKIKFRHIAASIIAVGLISSFVFGFFKVADFSKIDLYETTRARYSEYNGKTTTNTTKEEKTDNETYIYKYEPFELYNPMNNLYSRDVLEYDVSDYEYANLEDYLKIDLSNYTGASYTDRKLYKDIGILYDEAIYAVEKVVQGDEVVDQKTGARVFFFIPVYIVLWVIALFIYAGIDTKCHDKISKAFEGSIKELIDSIRSKDKSKILRELKNQKRLLDEDESLRKAFCMAYEKNKDKINDALLDAKYQEFTKKRVR